jgi:hypothetical protein
MQKKAENTSHIYKFNLLWDFWQEMEKERSLDKLVTVSKVFMDARVSELRKENENLRLQIFWRDYSIQLLADLMGAANNWDNSPKCNCLSCAVSGRMDGVVESDNARACAFVPWFEEKIAECGMTFGYPFPTSTNYQHMSNTNGGVYDVDCHFVKLGRGDWFFFTFGKRLYQAQSTDDPELKKLKKLFELLRNDD